MLNELVKELEDKSSREKAKVLQRFFKTGKGEYGEGDIFIGLTMPQQREIARKYLDLSLPKLQELLKSRIHEHRMTALIILVEKYKKSSERENIFGFYLRNVDRINNWDLVDLSCPGIVGDFLLDRDKKILYKLARSENLWERRIAMVSTYAFIKKDEFDDALAISEILLPDKHDLMHKAVGWMLREVGKKDQNILEKFLKQNYENISRTTLRYAIERFPEDKRKKFLRGEFK